MASAQLFAARCSVGWSRWRPHRWTWGGRCRWWPLQKRPHWWVAVHGQTGCLPNTDTHSHYWHHPQTACHTPQAADAATEQTWTACSGPVFQQCTLHYTRPLSCTEATHLPLYEHILCDCFKWMACWPAEWDGMTGGNTAIWLAGWRGLVWSTASIQLVFLLLYSMTRRHR